MVKVRVGLIGRPDSIGSRRKGVTGRADIQVRGAKKGGVVQSTENAGKNVMDTGKNAVPCTDQV